MLGTGLCGGIDALQFCCSTPSAVVVTVWPTAYKASNDVEKWLNICGADIVYQTEVDLPERAAVPTCMALYHGEDWLHSNCWYEESPLPEGPPDGPFAGAKWKAALTFKESAPLKVFVADSHRSRGELWRSKYSFRENLRQKVGAIGNGCIHVTDDQAAALEAWRDDRTASKAMRGGNACDSSFAYHCARVLLDDSSIAFLSATDISSPNFEIDFDAFTAYLSRQPTDNRNANIGDFPKWS